MYTCDTVVPEPVPPSPNSQLTAPAPPRPAPVTSRLAGPFTDTTWLPGTTTSSTDGGSGAADTPSRLSGRFSPRSTTAPNVPSPFPARYTRSRFP